MISSSSSHHQILLHHQSSIIKFPHDFKVMFFSKEGQCFSSQFFLRDLSPSNGPLVIQWPWQWPSKALDLLQQLRDQGLQASEPWIKTGCGDGMGLATAGDSEFYGFPMDVFYGCCWMYFEWLFSDFWLIKTGWFINSHPHQAICATLKFVTSSWDGLPISCHRCHLWSPYNLMAMAHMYGDLRVIHFGRIKTWAIAISDEILSHSIFSSFSQLILSSISRWISAHSLEILTDFQRNCAPKSPARFKMRQEITYTAAIKAPGGQRSDSSKFAAG